MITIVLVVHLLIAAALVGVILIQRSEGGALGGLGGASFGGLMSARGGANLLTRTTAVLASCFITTSMVLAILASHSGRGSLIDELPAPRGPLDAPAAPTAPVTTTVPPPAPAEPAAPVAR
jgi:preprotein translocase subunit SecG